MEFHFPFFFFNFAEIIPIKNIPYVADRQVELPQNINYIVKKLNEYLF